MTKRQNKIAKVNKSKLPGTIYLNKNRYWWKVQLPGEEKIKARPLKPIGSKFATTDINVAVEIAKNLYETAIYNAGSQGQDAFNQPIDTIAALSKAYLQCKLPARYTPAWHCWALFSGFQATFSV